MTISDFEKRLERFFPTILLREFTLAPTFDVHFSYWRDLDVTLKHNKRKKKGICTRFEWWETI
jgi:hypothetical protein